MPMNLIRMAIKPHIGAGLSSNNSKANLGLNIAKNQV